MRITIVLLVVIVAVACGMAIRYNQKAIKDREDLEQERYKRMTAEEKLVMAESTIGSLEGELKRALSKIEMIEQINSDLKSRLDKSQVFKDNLEKKIRELEVLSN